MARALARDPKVLLLDEPFAAVDRVTRHKLYRELAELRRQLAMPIVLVTHDLDEAAMLADRMCILHRGHTLQIGVPHEIRTRPADALVARLVDLRNVFEGVVRAQDAPARTYLDRVAGYRAGGRACAAVRGGRRVAWSIPVSGIVLHRRDRPSRGERENPVTGTVVECLALGDDTTVALADRRARRYAADAAHPHARRAPQRPGDRSARGRVVARGGDPPDALARNGPRRAGLKRAGAPWPRSFPAGGRGRGGTDEVG